MILENAHFGDIQKDPTLKSLKFWIEVSVLLEPRNFQIIIEDTRMLDPSRGTGNQMVLTIQS